ncbi:GDSL esterase/lipase At1g71250-like [Durio zibethinus]|uniref:GDSL esterase/lipase At1g71250-like n=1 Tax=Durio zibethinus TaxID=66656 RepID=A0A6P5XWT1_DURZI|nr:GDSL esterase/lipase At1g71250-like [Durio zibethinus]
MMEGFVLFLVAAVSMGVTNLAMGQEISSSNVSAMYVLGDSSVDCGVNALFYPIFHQDLSLLPCNGSNSILLPYLLAEKMGLPYTEPFYSQNGSVEGLLNGVNYGAAQATILSPSSMSHQSLNHQLRQVFETIQLLELQLGQESSYHFVRSSIFYLSFGQDDYIDLFLRNFSGVMVRYSGHEFAKILVNQMVHAIRNLYDMNARRIVCVGILPLGCTPSLLLQWHNPTARSNIDDGTGCVEEINDLVLQYNIMLEESIVRINEELPDALIVFCDLYQGVKKIITYPQFFGFEDAKSACCGLGLYGAEIGCLSSDMACNTVSSHVWWDLYNPTPEVNSLLADSAWSAEVLSNICRPTTVKNLVYTSVSHLT